MFLYRVKSYDILKIKREIKVHHDYTGPLAGVEPTFLRYDVGAVLRPLSYRHRWYKQANL